MSTREQIEMFVNGVLSDNNTEGMDSLRSVVQRKVAEIIAKKKYGDLPPPEQDNKQEDSSQ